MTQTLNDSNCSIYVKPLNLSDWCATRTLIPGNKVDWWPPHTHKCTHTHTHRLSSGFWIIRWVLSMKRRLKVNQDFFSSFVVNRTLFLRPVEKKQHIFCKLFQVLSIMKKSALKKIHLMVEDVNKYTDGLDFIFVRIKYWDMIYHIYMYISIDIYGWRVWKKIKFDWLIVWAKFTKGLQVQNGSKRECTRKQIWKLIYEPSQTTILIWIFLDSWDDPTNGSQIRHSPRSGCKPLLGD